MKPKCFIFLVIVAFVTLLYAPIVLATPILDSAQDFAVLGASTVSNTGSTTIYGDVGLYDGPSIVGFKIPPDNTVVEGPGSTGLIAGPGVVTGTIYISHAVAQQALSDASVAYTTLAGLSPDATLSGSLGTLTLNAGVYDFTGGAALLTGALTLDAEGNPNAKFVFQTESTLKLDPGSSVNVINGGPGNEVYWVVGTSATLAGSTVFAGNILADQSITLITAADILCGRAIALNGAVTMDTNRISNNNTLEDFDTGRSDFGSLGFSGGSGSNGGNGGVPVPEPATMLLLGSGLLGLAGFARRKFKNVDHCK